MTEFYSGGCQCGAVRFRATGPITHASICNCRMCQKAFGNFMAPFAAFAGPVDWSRGAPKEFQSSTMVQRGFCADCGTPLSYRWGEGKPSLAIGAFDRPDDIMPTAEYARDNRHPIIGHIDSLASEPLGATDEERDLLAILKSFQHPDRDTDAWPPKEST